MAGRRGNLPLAWPFGFWKRLLPPASAPSLTGSRRTACRRASQGSKRRRRRECLVLIGGGLVVAAAIATTAICCCWPPANRARRAVRNFWRRARGVPDILPLPATDARPPRSSSSVSNEKWQPKKTEPNANAAGVSDSFSKDAKEEEDKDKEEAVKEMPGQPKKNWWKLKKAEPNANAAGVSDSFSKNVPDPSNTKSAFIGDPGAHDPEMSLNNKIEARK